MTKTQETAELRGLARLLSHETSVSDLLQHLTDLDPEPWTTVPGIEHAPTGSTRERSLRRLKGKRVSGTADLELTIDNTTLALVEVKLSHVFSADQRRRYEASAPATAALVLAGIEIDRRLVRDHSRWSFISLTDLFGRWVSSRSVEAAQLAAAAVAVLRGWDQLLDDVFEPSSSPQRRDLLAVNKKFLARLSARRIAERLAETWMSSAHVTSGGGLAIAQAWATIDRERGEYLIAEVRWHEGLKAGELRFGVDFEAPATRASAYGLARAMSDKISVDSLKLALRTDQCPLDLLLTTTGTGRPRARGDWDAVVERGLHSRGADGAVKGTRLTHTPDFFGDGTLRHEAKSTIDFARASANDLVQLIDATLQYLTTCAPTDWPDRAEEAITA